jgi:hypothetical protein
LKNLDSVKDGVEAQVDSAALDEAMAPGKAKIQRSTQELRASLEKHELSSAQLNQANLSRYLDEFVHQFGHDPTAHPLLKIAEDLVKTAEDEIHAMSMQQGATSIMESCKWAVAALKEATNSGDVDNAVHYVGSIQQTIATLKSKFSASTGVSEFVSASESVLSQFAQKKADIDAAKAIEAEKAQKLLDEENKRRAAELEKHAELANQLSKSALLPFPKGKLNCKTDGCYWDYELKGDTGYATCTDGALKGAMATALVAATSVALLVAFDTIQYTVAFRDGSASGFVRSMNSRRTAVLQQHLSSPWNVGVSRDSVAVEGSVPAEIVFAIATASLGASKFAEIKAKEIQEMQISAPFNTGFIYFRVLT